MIITEWIEEDIKGIKISRTRDIKIPLFGDDQVIASDSEDAQQIPVHKLERVTSKYGFATSNKQNKNNADPVRSKTVIKSNIIGEKNKHFHLPMLFYFKAE